MALAGGIYNRVFQLPLTEIPLESNKLGFYYFILILYIFVSYNSNVFKKSYKSYCFSIKKGLLYKYRNSYITDEHKNYN